MVLHGPRSTLVFDAIAGDNAGVYKARSIDLFMAQAAILGVDDSPLHDVHQQRILYS